MRALLQRVAAASVTVAGERVADIGVGLLVLAGVSRHDDEEVVDRMATKVLALRVFPDDEGRMNRDVRQVRGAVLAVSQFTLYADARGGNRPSFAQAAAPESARPLFDRFAAALQAGGVEVGTGVFGANMAVELNNDGPVTIMLDSEVLWPGRYPS